MKCSRIVLVAMALRVALSGDVPTKATASSPNEKFDSQRKESEKSYQLGVQCVEGEGKFEDSLRTAALGAFGSGWAWLTTDHTGRLAIGGTPNQDTPLSAGRQPVLGIDVWEHAYYLKYQNRRPDYVAAFFHVINWESVNERFAKLSA